MKTGDKVQISRPADGLAETAQIDILMGTESHTCMLLTVRDHGLILTQRFGGPWRDLEGNEVAVNHG